MRFLMINLILVCLLLFGIGYLAFGDTDTEADLESDTCLHIHHVENTPWKASFETLESRERELAPIRRGNLNKTTKLLENYGRRNK
ncbi:MAG: hypothetical protein OXU36_18640 [Candidatus Poribacteria bacterium]|nr:hypothetical protein [Candidatus Poribacteria bacterium]